MKLVGDDPVTSTGNNTRLPPVEAGAKARLRRPHLKRQTHAMRQKYIRQRYKPKVKAKGKPSSTTTTPLIIPPHIQHQLGDFVGLELVQVVAWHSALALAFE